MYVMYGSDLILYVMYMGGSRMYGRGPIIWVGPKCIGGARIMYVGLGLFLFDMWYIRGTHLPLCLWFYAYVQVPMVPRGRARCDCIASTVFHIL